MIPRLYVTTPLSPGAEIPLEAAQVHYLRNVLRREEGAALRLFNERDGEYAAQLSQIGKKAGMAILDEQTRAPKQEPEVSLLFAPIKRTPTEYIIEKGTELGVARFMPVLTARTNSDRLKVDRLQAIAIEAAEQSGRLNAPTVAEPVKLMTALSEWSPSDALIFCDEAGDDPEAPWGGDTGRAAPILAGRERQPDTANGQNTGGVLIGPEGGFTPDERAALRGLAFVRPVSLGPRILRADTAAIAALTLWQASLGDWRG